MLTLDEKRVLFEATGRAFGAISRAAGLMREACLAVARDEARELEGVSGRRPQGGAVAARRDSA